MCSCKKEKKEIIKDIEVAEVNIDPITLNITEGDTKELIATVLPEDAKDKTITWECSDDSVVEVDESGVISAIKEGTADITVKSVNEKSAICKVNVVKKEIPIEKIVVTPAEMTLLEGTSQQISAAVYPSNTTDDISISLRTTDKNVALIDDYGLVYAQNAGTANIEVILTNGMKGICKVTVIEPSDLIMDIPDVEILKQRGFVQKILKGNEQIAEICLEYIKTSEIAEQILVIYPYSDGKADVTKGISLKDGGSIVWDLALNTCNYTKGSKSPTQIIFTDGLISLGEGSEAETKKITMLTDKLVDKRSNDTQNYRLVKIGTQYWMAENLRAEHTTDGVEIMNLTTTKEWLKDARGAYCYYENDEENKEPYGALYNNYVVENLAIAPIGYHVTANVDWAKMAKYLDPSTYDENAIDYETYNESTNIAPLLKSTTEWKKEGNGNNLSGLNIYPAGVRIRSTVGDFFSLNAFGLFWTSDKNSENTAYFRRLFYDMNTVNIFYANVENGYSIRCVRDSE